jgi:hypothetical protein
MEEAATTAVGVLSEAIGADLARLIGLATFAFTVGMALYERYNEYVAKHVEIAKFKEPMLRACVELFWKIRKNGGIGMMMAAGKRYPAGTHIVPLVTPTEEEASSAKYWTNMKASDAEYHVVCIPYMFACIFYYLHMLHKTAFNTSKISSAAHGGSFEKIVGNLRSAFSTSDFQGPFRVLYHHQSAIGEQMASEKSEHTPQHCIGYAEFTRRLQTDQSFFEWMRPLFRDTAAVVTALRRSCGSSEPVQILGGAVAGSDDGAQEDWIPFDVPHADLRIHFISTRLLELVLVLAGDERDAHVRFPWLGRLRQISEEAEVKEFSLERMNLRRNSRSANQDLPLPPSWRRSLKAWCRQAVEPSWFKAAAVSVMLWLGILIYRRISSKAASVPDQVMT